MSRKLIPIAFIMMLMGISLPMKLSETISGTARYLKCLRKREENYNIDHIPFRPYPKY